MSIQESDELIKTILLLKELPKIRVRYIEKIIDKYEYKNIYSPKNFKKMLLDYQKNENDYNYNLEIINFDNLFKKVDNILLNSDKMGIKIISKWNKKFPNLLKQIKYPPILLHIKGQVDILSKKSIAIIGRRAATDYGKHIAYELAKNFVQNDFSIVSGLADGIDTAGHWGAIREKGLTVAVLAHGLDMIYPYKNKDLAEKILENNGALISEYPIGVKPNKAYFVLRDRLQSGLSLAVVVVETTINSGTMHTVRYAKEQNRLLIVHKPKNQKIYYSPEYEGNKKLIEEKQVDIIYSNDIDDLLIKIKEKTNNLI